MRKQTLGLAGALLALTFVATACGGRGDANSEAQGANDAYEVRVQQSAPNVDEERSRATEARLEQLAEGIQEVKHANCVIVGNTAIVGIDVGGDVERSRVGTIKYAVAEALRKDPVGIHAIVTADMDLNHRLQEIRQDMANGRPIEGIAEELADIVGRIVPQLPRDTQRIGGEPEDPMAATQERGVNQVESEQNGSTKASNAGEPKDNRDFPGHPSNR
ncbi:YhcN/YlaJ family sporulation lipoprotein [Paenibacillus sp.]|uniref:YhcN/YlaJ family sporulation lipoprotein n=1 Tax=Paenibacillus sp. TaxID=58172 RepID=UPI002D4AFA1A|nr:YhcN/YlaJ family sporulation lipoprotein [Paenibacillus sp.]HZG55892.1 YhcN/YlaJ family sporulation lipoprotein [Paenibacillus sp.]